MVMSWNAAVESGSAAYAADGLLPSAMAAAKAWRSAAAASRMSCASWGCRDVSVASSAYPARKRLTWSSRPVPSLMGSYVP